MAVRTTAAGRKRGSGVVPAVERGVDRTSRSLQPAHDARLALGHRGPFPLPRGLAPGRRKPGDLPLVNQSAVTSARPPTHRRPALMTRPVTVVGMPPPTPNASG